MEALVCKSFTVPAVAHIFLLRNLADLIVARRCGKKDQFELRVVVDKEEGRRHIFPLENCQIVELTDELLHTQWGKSREQAETEPGMNKIEKVAREWLKGCSCSTIDPEECQECTRDFLDAVKVYGKEPPLEEQAEKNEPHVRKEEDGLMNVWTFQVVRLKDIEIYLDHVVKDTFPGAYKNVTIKTEGKNTSIYVSVWIKASVGDYTLKTAALLMDGDGQHLIHSTLKKEPRPHISSWEPVE